MPLRRARLLDTPPAPDADVVLLPETAWPTRGDAGDDPPRSTPRAQVDPETRLRRALEDRRKLRRQVDALRDELERVRDERQATADSHTAFYKRRADELDERLVEAQTDIGALLVGLLAWRALALRADPHVTPPPVSLVSIGTHRRMLQLRQRVQTGEVSLVPDDV